MPLTPEQKAIAQKKLRLLELERERAMALEQESAAPAVAQPPSEGDVATAAAYDAIAKLGRGIDYLGGFGRTAAMEALERGSSAGAKGVGPENWQRALKGQAKPFEDYFQERGMTDKLYANKVAGLVADTVTDPLSYVVAGKKAIGALRGLNPWSEVGNALLKSDGANLIQAPLRLTRAANQVGKRVYRMPFGKVAKDMSTYIDAHRYHPYEAVDELYNANVSGSGQHLKDAFEARRKGARESYISATEGYFGDLAPSVTADKMAAGKQAVNDYIEAQAKKIEGTLLAGGADKEAARAAGEDVRSQLRVMADDGHDDLVRIAEDGQDQFVKGLKEKLRKAVSGEANERRRAVDQLKSRLDPNFHAQVDKAVEMADTVDQEHGLKAIDQLLNAAFSGEKSLADLDDIAARFGKKASGSDAFGTNVYKASGKKDTSKALASKSGSNIKGFIEDQMSPEDAEKYLAGKREYGKYARSKKHFLGAIDASAGEPLVSALDAAGLAMGLAPAVAAKRGLQTFRKFPQVSSRLGVGIKKAGEFNIWDNIARQGAAKLLADDEAK